MQTTLTAKQERRTFYRQLCAIALPVAFQNLLTTTASMVDTIMLSQLGENAVAAVGLCAQFSSLMFSCYWGFVGGGMLFMSQYWGAKDEDGVCRSFGLTLAFMLTVGLIFGGLSRLAPETIMRLYTNKTELWPLGVQYLRIVGFSFPLSVVSMAISCMMRSTERVRLPLYASVVSLSTNMVLNYLLIGGRMGFPALGLRGAAIATLVAAVVQLVLLAVMSKITHYDMLFRFRKHFCWSKTFLKHYLIKCYPILCNELAIGVGNMTINIVLGRQSTQAIAALAVFRVFEGFVIAFFAGFTNAASVLVGKAVGAGEHALAWLRAKRLVWLTPLTVGAGCVLFLCFHGPFLHAMNLYGETFEIARSLLFLFTVVGVIRMTNWICNDTFRAGGNPEYGTILEITFMYLMVLPSICTAGLLLQAPFLAVFLCAYIDEPVRIVLMLRRMFNGRWIRPVTQEGLATIDAFRAQHHIAIKEKKGKKRQKQKSAQNPQEKNA